jgi:hypothetical protein
VSDDRLEEFAKELRQRVEEGITSDSPFSAHVFTQLILEDLEEAGHMEGTFALHQEGRVGKSLYRIDGYAYDEERSRLDLVTTVYHGDAQIQKLSNADAVRAYERALRFATACVDGLADNLEPSNTDASDLARRIESEAADLADVRIVLLTDAILAGTWPKTKRWMKRTVEFHAYDIVALQRIIGEGQTRADIVADFVSLTGSALPCLHVPAPGGEYDAYLTVLPAAALSQIYDRYGVRLLELNVRAFLGMQGRKSVNAELRRTIVESPSMFLAYNNGLVATVDQIDIVRTKAGVEEITGVKGLQIVNGGQTTALLHRTREKESNDLAQVSVPVKIIKVAGGDLVEMVGAISRAANRQNSVQLADFSANDPFHQEIEMLANNTWLDDGKSRWFYERARGSYVAAEQKASYRKSDHKTFRSETPKARRFSKLDVARYLAVWDGLPHRVCLGGQKNFQFFMQRLKDEPLPTLDTDWYKRLIAIAVLYRSVEKNIRLAKFPAYGAQIIAYLVSGLSFRNGGYINSQQLWSAQATSSEMNALIKEWAPQINSALRESAGQLNPSEWFKKEQCWEAIKTVLPIVKGGLPPELASIDK